MCKNLFKSSGHDARIMQMMLAMQGSAAGSGLAPSTLALQSLAKSGEENARIQAEALADSQQRAEEARKAKEQADLLAAVKIKDRVAERAAAQLAGAVGVRSLLSGAKGGGGYSRSMLQTGSTF